MTGMVGRGDVGSSTHVLDWTRKDLGFVIDISL